MNLNELKKHLKTAAGLSPSHANFSDAQSAAKNALIEHFGMKDMSVREIRKHRWDIFEIIEEVVDERVPQAVEERTGDFAEVKQFGRDQRPVFKIQTAFNSRRRLYKAIQRGARGGVYKSYKLDGYNLEMQTRVESVGYMITLEDILTGNRTIAELTQILADAWIEKIYTEVFEALSIAADEAPDVNQMTNLTISGGYNDLDKIIRIIKAYGQPRILGFSQHIAELNNSMDTSNGVYPEADLDDVRNRGHVGVYKGTPIIELPNYLVDATNTNWLFDEEKMFILPADERPVKIAFQGESYTQDHEQVHGGIEYHNHRMMGVTVLFSNSIGSVTFEE